MANVLLAEQLAYRASVAVLEDEHAADSTLLDGFVDQLEAVAQPAAQLLPQRLYDALVVRVKDERHHVNSQEVGVTFFQAGKLGHKREQVLQWPEVAREDHLLVAQGVQA